jgi:CRISPR-associated protein Cst2
MKKELNDITAACLIDAQHTFLNGAGGEKGAENQTASTVKKYYDGKKKMPYVSAQAGRRMLRDTMIEETGWPSSEIKVLKLSLKGSTSKSGGEFNPVDYPEDDICGYMRTEPKPVKDKTKKSTNENEEGVDDEDAVVVEEVKKEMIHVKGLQRTSPLNMPMFRSLYATLNTDHAWNHPKIGTPNPYDTEFYSATLECVMGLDYKRLGVFKHG